MYFIVQLKFVLLCPAFIVPCLLFRSILRLPSYNVYVYIS